jgi:hypothetical protein
MLDRPHIPRIRGCQLRAGSVYWLLMSATGIEMRFGEPVAPDAIRIDVITIDGQLIEETRLWGSQFEDPEPEAARG